MNAGPQLLCSAALAVALVPVELLDTFTESDGTQVSAHTPDTNTFGWAWEAIYAPAQIPLISSGRLTATAPEEGTQGMGWLWNANEQHNWTLPSSWQFAFPWTLAFSFNMPDVSGGEGTVSSSLILQGVNGQVLNITCTSTNSTFGGPTTTSITLEDTLYGTATINDIDAAVPHTVSLLIEATQITPTVDGIPLSPLSLQASPSLWSLNVIIPGVLPGLSVLSADPTPYFDDLHITGSASLVPGSEE
jgi:hypothetical protein